MAKVKPNRQQIVDFLIKEIENAKDRGEALAKVVEKWQISSRTFDRYWKTANEKHSERLNLANKALDEAYVEKKVEALTEGLKSDIELEIILCQIATNNCEVEEWVKGEKVLRGVTPMECINAIKTIYLKRGSNAPTKVANTDSKGNDVATLIISPIGQHIPLAKSESEIDETR